MTDPRQRISQAQTDLNEVDLPELAGELDAETAARLRNIYRAEISEAEAGLGSDQAPTEVARSRRRVFAGTLAIVVAFGAITFAASRAVTERQGGFITGTGAETPMDLDSISNEDMAAAIEANRDVPQVNAMRLALAERYFESDDYQSALPWFQDVLDNNPTPPEASEALARIGWMVYASGEPEVGEQYLGRAIELDPDNLEAELLLGLLLLDTGRGGEAVSHLERVAATELPDEVRQLVDEALAAARSGS